MFYFDPLEQFSVFVIFPIFVDNWDFSITNFFVFCLLVFLVFYFLVNNGLMNAKLVGNPYQNVVELLYNFMAGLLTDNFDNKHANKFFVFISSVFFFILFSNLLGMVPYSFTLTSHIIMTFSFSLIIFIYFVLIAVVKYKKHFFSHFFPEGSPLWLAPLLVVIEIISYVLRVISLSVRLFANMMSGHTLLKVLATFGWILLCSKGFLFLLGFAPIVILFLLTGLELGVAFLQAYVFTVLTIIYIEESVNFH